MTQQKIKEEFPITRVLKKQANVELLPLDWPGYKYRITRGEQVIYLTTNSYGKVTELTHEWKKVWKRDLWTMLSIASKHNTKFCWYKYILRDE